LKSLMPATRKTGNVILASTFGLLAALGPSLDARAESSRVVRVGVKLPGLMEPLPVSVSSTGEATVLEYPKRWSGSLEAVAFASPFGQEFGGTLCEGVSSRIRMFGDASIPSMMKDHIRESIRKVSSITLRASSVSFLPTLGLQRAILDAANLAGLALNAVNLTNPIVASAYEVDLVLTDKALSRALSEEDELRAQLAGVFGAGTLLTGETGGEFSAVDLACDLRSGEAQVSLRFKGTVSGGAADRNLVSDEIARDLVQRLEARKGEFLSETSALDSRRNAFLAGMVLGEELRALKATSTSAQDRIALFERLFSLSSGRPLALAGDALTKAIRVPSTGSTPFSGTAVLRLNASGDTP